MKPHLRTLLNELPHGSTIRSSGDNHMDVFLPDGSKLRDARGLPIKVALSPSGVRTTRNARARIRRALRDQT